MRSSTIAAILTGLGALTHAAPTADGAAVKPRQFEAQITFQGAPPDAAFFTLSVPTDGSGFSIYNPLSISHISSAGGASCVFFGVDGSLTTVVGASTVDVGPPQTQVGGSCSAL